MGYYSNVCFVGGGFSFIVIGESISDSEYVHVCLQALIFFFFFTFSLVSYVTLDSQSGRIYGFKHFDEYLATMGREGLIDPFLFTRHWGYRGSGGKKSLLPWD